MLKNSTFETRVNENASVLGRTAALCLLAAIILTVGCTKSRTREKGQVHVWPPHGEERSGAASFEISDEKPASTNPRAQVAGLADSQPAPVISDGQLDAVAKRDTTNVPKADGLPNSDRRFSAEQQAEFERHMSAFQAFADKKSNDKTPPVAQMKDDLKQLVADQPQPKDVPADMPEKLNARHSQAMADADVSIGSNEPTLRRMPSPPKGRPNLKSVQSANYAETTSDAHLMGRVQEISPGGYEGGSNNTATPNNRANTPTQGQPTENQDSATTSNESEEVQESPSTDLGPQQPSRFSIKPGTSRYSNDASQAPTSNNEPPATEPLQLNPAPEANLETLPQTDAAPTAAPTKKNETQQASSSVPTETVAATQAGGNSPSKTGEEATPATTALETAATGIAATGLAATGLAATGLAATGLAATGQAASKATNAAPKEEDWRTGLYRSIDQLDRQIARETDPLVRQRMEASHRVLHALLSDREKALRPIAGTGPQSQKYWSEQNLALITMLDPLGSPQDSRRARLASRHLKNAQRQLAASSGLDVRNVLLCQQVMGFGWYKEFKPGTFKPDQEVILYAELENFSFAELGEGYETEFQSGYQVYDDAGRRVAEHDFLVVKQVCRNVQTDYFLPYRMHIPKHLVPGKYRLQLTVEDRKGNKFGQSLPIDFEVVR